MRGETQAIHLAKIMQKHKLYPEYELILPFVQVKKNSLKRLSSGDVLLVGLDCLKMALLEEGTVCANVVIDKSENSRKLRIIQLSSGMIKEADNKKYEIVKISFGIIQSRTLEIGHKIGLTSLNLKEITLVVEGKNIAKGSLVNVDEEIAVQIDEVRK